VIASADPSPCARADYASEAFKQTVNPWRAWVARSTHKSRWREMVNRSALVLKLLTSREHGSIVAALTFGLPETVGGQRNWDYRSRTEGVMSRLRWERTLVTGLVMAAGTLVLFRWELDQTGSLARAQTVALTTMVLFQMFHVWNCRSNDLSAFRKSPFSNPLLFVASATAFVIHAGALYVPVTQIILRVEPLGIDAWIRMVAVAASIIVAIEIHKLTRPGSRPVRVAKRPDKPALAGLAGTATTQ
jgi:magnesium-transporting ATPase (P-type)